MLSICYKSHINLWKKIKVQPETITKIQTFLAKYNWEGINYPSEKDNWRNIEKNYPTKNEKISCLCSKT